MVPQLDLRGISDIPAMDLNELISPKIVTPDLNSILLNGQREVGLFVSMSKGYLGPYLVAFAFPQSKTLICRR